MRIALRALALTCLLSQPLGLLGQNTPQEKELETAMKGKVLSLHNFYVEMDQHFDSEGQFRGKSNVGSWTMYGKMEVKKISFSYGQMKIDGERVWTLFRGDPQKSLMSRAGNYMTIYIDRSSGNDRDKMLMQALGKVFVSGKQSVADDVPEYWKQLVTAIVEREKNLGAASPKGPEANKSVAKKATAPVGVSEPVSNGLLIKRVQPEYPRSARDHYLMGTVVLKALISKTGDITDLNILHAAGAGLDEAAFEAVKQWKYRPYQLNGEPIEVATEITVNFVLADRPPIPER